MTERPILFQGAMVRAILDGSKTQTRRLVKPEPVRMVDGLPHGNGPGWAHAAPGSVLMRCPYGTRGDKLWVKELHRTYSTYDGESFARMQQRLSARPGEMSGIVPLQFDADSSRVNWLAQEATPGKRRPSIHMPRWASRLTLEITGVRVERMQDISEADSIAEGIELVPGPEPYQMWCDYSTPNTRVNCPILSYQTLWESINGPGSWDLNPWVWVVEFRRLS